MDVVIFVSEDDMDRETAVVFMPVLCVPVTLAARVVLVEVVDATV